MWYNSVPDPRVLREQERATAQAAENAANIDFIAIMSGIDIEEDTEDEQSL